MTPARKKKVESCDVIVILDRSGSMASIKQDMEGGLNRFVEEQAKLPGACRFTLVQFDSSGRDTVYDDAPIASVKSISIEPRGSTPLLDAVGATISTRKDRNGKVVCLIITDGQENASREWKLEGVKNLVKEVSEKGWAVSYLGANVDAFAEAGGMGIATENTLNYRADPHGTRQVFAAAAAATTSYRSSAGFTVPDSLRSDLDRQTQP